MLYGQRVQHQDLWSPNNVWSRKWIYERSYIWTEEKDMNLRLIIAVIHTTWTVVKFKPEKNSGLNGIRTHDLCDTGAVLYRLSYQTIWELVTLWVRNIPVESEECKWICERSYIWTVEKDMNLRLIIAVIHTTWAVVKFKPEKNSGLNGIWTHDLCDTGAVLYRLSYQATWEHVCKILNNFLLLNRFLRLGLNENLLPMNFLSHFFHLVPCIWEFSILKVGSNLHAGFLHI